MRICAHPFPSSGSSGQRRTFWLSNQQKKKTVKGRRRRAGKGTCPLGRWCLKGKREGGGRSLVNTKGGEREREMSITELRKEKKQEEEGQKREEQSIEL